MNFPDPSDWVETDGELVFYDVDGNEIVRFREHYRLNPETGEAEPANPPEQPGAESVEVVQL